MSRRWLIAVSLVAHLAVAAGLFVSGVWHIERLHADRLPFELRAPVSIPAASGGLVATSHEPVRPKIPVPPKVLVQPVVTPPVPASTTATSSSDDASGPGSGTGGPLDTGTCLENCGEAAHVDPVCGNSSREAGEDCDDGNTLDGDGCSATCRTEARRPQVSAVAPSVLQGLRIAGDTAVHPSTSTQTLMMHDGADKVIGTIKVCIATDGSVASTSLQRSTKYPDYDDKLVSAARDWRYRPYTLNGTPVPVCSMVTFVYRTR